MDWFEKNKIDAQKVAPYNHRANITERMIETAKHHFIAGMAGTDKNFPITQWDRCVPQSQRSLNMLRPCIINPKLSADAFLEGQHDYNAVPFPPLGWRMFNDCWDWGTHLFHCVIGNFSSVPAIPAIKWCFDVSIILSEMLARWL